MQKNARIEFAKKAVIIILAWWGMLTLANHFGLRQTIENGIKRPLEVKVREWQPFGKSHELINELRLDPRIKMIVFDERTVANIKRPDLTTEEWGKVLKSLSDLKPKAILLDFMFSLPFEQSQIKILEDAVLSSKAPIFSAAQVRNFPVEGKNDLVKFSQENGFKFRFEEPGLRYLRDQDQAIERRYVYGAIDEIARSVKGLGHILYDGIGNIQPVIALGDNKFVRHLSLMIASEVSGDGQHLSVEGEQLTLDRNGMTPVNFRSERYYFNEKNTISLNGILKSAVKGKPIPKEFLQEGDVLIISKTFFGSTDFAQTPAGYMPGVYALASVVDSVLTGRWLHKKGESAWTTLVFAMLGGALAFYLPSVGFMMGIFLGASSIVLAGFTTIRYSNVLLPWDISFLAFIGGAFAVFGEKFRMVENRSKQLRYRLTRFIPSTRLSEMIKRPETMVWDPCGKVVSIMFVDIVSFSTTVEKQGVTDVFYDLREMINSVIETIHKHGGIVQKTLGDGVLAHFGYDYDGEKTRREHTDRTVACAVEIQQKNLGINLRRTEEGKFVYPLRIGIHTSNVFLGNIGDDLLPDITMVGHGVNFAKRMEDTCEPFRVMLSATTFECINAELFKECEFSTRQIHVKHFDKPVTATEINPVIGKEAEQKKIEQHFRDCLGIERHEMRWPLGGNALLKVTSPQTSGKVMDYSRSGFLLQLDKYYGKGVRLTLNLISENSEINALLERHAFHQIVVEVRWGSMVKDEFVHGVMISSLTEKQKVLLEDILKAQLAKTEFFSDAG